MERFCKKCISFFVSNNLIKSEYEEVYCYALNIILSSLIHIATVIVLGWSFDLLLESLVYYFLLYQYANLQVEDIPILR